MVGGDHIIGYICIVELPLREFRGNVSCDIMIHNKF